MSERFEACVACRHGIGLHYTDPTGKVRCSAHTVRQAWGTVDLGYCPCTDYVLPEAERRAPEGEAPK